MSLKNRQRNAAHETAKQLEEEHRRLKEAQAAGGVGSFEWNLVTDKIVWSDELYRIHGLPNNLDITTDNIFSLIHPDDLQRTIDEAGKCLKAPCRSEFTVKMIKPSGEQRITTLSLQSFANKNGKVSHISGMVKDVTEQKQAEQALKESKDLLQGILDAPNIGISVMKALRNKDGAIDDFEMQFVNKRTLEAFGGKDPTGLRVKSFGIDGAEQLVHLKEAIESQKKNSYIRKAESGIVEGWFLFSNAPLGEDLVVQVWEDITKIKKAEEAVIFLMDEITQNATNKYLTLFNSIDEGFCIFEMIFDEQNIPVDYRFIEHNAAFERHTGLTNAVGCTIRELLPLSDAHWFELYGRVALTGEPVRVTRYGEALNRWIKVYAFRIGKPEQRRVATLFSDITEEKEIELKLKASEERKAFLLKVSDTVRYISDPTFVQESITKVTLDFFMADQCFYCQIENDTALTQHDLRRNNFALTASQYLFVHNPVFKAAINGGKVFVVNDIAVTNTIDDALRDLCLQFSAISFVTLPVIKNGIPQGVFCLIQSKPKHWTHQEIELLQEIAERTWVAVERAKTEEALRASEKHLKELNENLEKLVTKRTEELTTLKVSQEKEKLNAVIFAQEQERARIGEGLHNGVAQLLYAVQSRLQNLNPVNQADIATLKRTNEILSDAIQDTKRISFELMPPILREYGLKVSLETLAQKIFPVNPILVLDINLTKRLPDELEISVYRIAQEIINNILRHSMATQARLALGTSRNFIRLTTDDNGIGFAAGKTHKGIGLQSICNRVKLLNGKIKIRSKPGKGTLIEVQLPLKCREIH